MSPNSMRRSAVVGLIAVAACSTRGGTRSSGDDVATAADGTTIVADVANGEDASVDISEADTPAPEDAPQDDVAPVDPCANGGGCAPNATCAPDGDVATCTCNEGWVGSGTTCGYNGVIVRDIDTYEAGGFTTAVPGDPAYYTKVVVVASVGGVPSSFPAEAPVEGVYYVPDVPEGPYALQLWRAPNAKLVEAGPTLTVVHSAERILSIGIDFSYRAGTTLLTQPTTITVSGPLAIPWETPATIGDETASELKDELLIYSRGAYLYSVASPTKDANGDPIGPLPGDESLQGWTIDIVETSGLGDARALEGALGDELLVGHFRQGLAPTDGSPITGFETWRTLRSSFEVPNATLPSGGNLLVEGAFEPNGVASVAFHYDGDAFGAAVAPFADLITSASANVVLLMENGDPDPKTGPFVDLVFADAYGQYAWTDPVCNGDLDPCDPSVCPAGCSGDLVYTVPGDMVQTFTYANPFDYGQLIASGTLSFQIRVTDLLPDGEGNDRVSGTLTTNGKLEALNGKPIAPLMGLPSDIRVAGLEAPATRLLRGVGFTPEITWAAPTVGAPNNYRVQVWELTDLPSTSGTVNARRVVLNALLSGTSLRVPAGLLLPNRFYSVEVKAEDLDTYDPASPFTASAAYAAASMPSGVFTVCGCDKNATCTIDGAGKESCACKDGWLGDGQSCAPEPCAVNNGGCVPESLCDGSSGSAVCVCAACDESEYCDAIGVCIPYGDRCENPLPLVDTVSGTTAGLGDDHALDDGNPCIGTSMGSGSPDAVYLYTASKSGDVTFTLDAAFDAALSVRPDCASGCYGADIERGLDGRFTVTVSLPNGTSVFVVVDGYANDFTPFSGPYTLSVASSTPPLICEAPPIDVAECAGSAGACQCVGCLDDGICSSDKDDCVCADCQTDGFCTNAGNCDGNGVCSPYDEGCQCADCAAHPACNPG